jgi:hypothetical protein
MIGLVGTGDEGTHGGSAQPFSIGARCASVGGATANGPVFGKSGGLSSFDVECPQGKVVTGVQEWPEFKLFGLLCQ